MSGSFTCLLFEQCGSNAALTIGKPSLAPLFPPQPRPRRPN